MCVIIEGFLFYKGMRIAEIQEIEKTNFENIFLFKEGMFWRAYERSAMLFSVYIKTFKLIKRYVKCVGQHIVYMGFPDSTLDRILNEAKGKGYNVEKQNNDIIALGGFKTDGNFEQWKSEIPVIAMNKEIDNQFELIIEKIKNYPVANKTPVEALEFLAKIQKEIIESIKL